MTYPQLIIELTDGNTTKNVSFYHPKNNVSSQEVSTLGGELADAFENFNFVQGHLVTDSIISAE